MKLHDSERPRQISTSTHFFQLFELIANNPFKFELVDHIKKGYRRCPCGSDTNYFRLSESSVEIMAIIGKQDLKNLL